MEPRRSPAPAISRVRTWHLVVALMLAALGTPAAADAADGWTGLIVNSVTFADSVTPFATSTNTPSSSVYLGGFLPAAIAVAPDARTAYVAEDAPNNGSSGWIIPIDLTTSPPTAKPKVTIPGATTGVFCVNGPQTIVAGIAQIAITPDGTTAYVTDIDSNAVYPVDLTTSPVQPKAGIALGTGAKPIGEAITPDGATVFVANFGTDSITPVSTLTNTAGTPISLAAGAKPAGLAVTPDGRTAYATESGLGKTVPIDVATRTVGTPITVDSGPGPVAIAPDGATAYVASGGPGACPGQQNGNNTVTPIATATNTPGTAVSVPGAAAPAVTPDGKTLYVTTAGTNGSVNQDYPIPTATMVPGTPFAAGSFPGDQAITPDQAPSANFTVSGGPSGTPVTFDASASVSPAGTVTGYAWDFGDGATATKTVPTTTHVYATDGTFTATLTVTNSAGTSTERVFTGRTMSRNGGPSARAAKTVIVTAGPAPSVALSRSAIDFGVVAVGRSAGPEPLRVTNTGAAPLEIGAVTLGGRDAGDFRVDSDSCARRSIPVGDSCAVGVVFTPSGDRASQATLAMADNASGSPHVVRLVGRGTTVGAVGGTVRDSTTAGDPPVDGASVSVCTYSTHAVCRSQRTGTDGTYFVTGLPEGRYQIEVFPPGNRLFVGSAVADAGAGSATTQDFDLRAPRGVPAGVEFNGSAGGSGAPGSSFWMAPMQVGLPLLTGTGVAAGNLGASVVRFSAAPGTDGEAERSFGALTVIYRYDAAGIPRFVEADGADPFVFGAPVAGFDGLLGSWNVSLDGAPAIGADVRGLRVSATLTPPSRGPFFHGAASYEIQQTTIAFVDQGTPARRGYPVRPAQSGFGSHMGHLNHPNGIGETMSGPKNANCDVKVLPNGRTYDKRHNTLKDPAGSRPRRIYTKVGDKPVGKTPDGHPLWQFRGEDGKPYRGDGVTGDVYDQNGNRVNPSAAPGTRFRAVGARSRPHAAGAGDFGDGGAPVCQHDDDADGYIDPSGVVVTRSGVPVPGARVTLARADLRAGPFGTVPNGSEQMSPSNRVNPDRTGADGHFGWDVLPGFYRVTAQRPGCRGAAGRTPATRTPALEIPPPVTDLRMILSCPNLRRAVAGVLLRGKRVGVAERILLARVRARGRPAAGVVEFVVGRHRLGKAALDRRGMASVSVVSRRALGRVSARYLGNGLVAPGSATARVR